MGNLWDFNPKAQPLTNAREHLPGARGEAQSVALGGCQGGAGGGGSG